LAALFEGGNARHNPQRGPHRRVNSMAVPRKKVSRMKRGTRRSAEAISAPSLVEDKKTGNVRRPHHIDLKAGTYRDRQILPAKSDV
jgi:large subunit ribosomal protein L32